MGTTCMKTRRSRHGDLVISEMIHILTGASQRLKSYEPWSIEHDGTSQIQSTVTVSRESWSTEHDGTSQLQSTVTASRESWSTEHDGTSQLGSKVTVSRKSWFIEHDGTSQLGSTVTVSRKSWFIEHDGTSQLGSRSQCHVSRGSLNTMERYSWDQWSRCHAKVTVSRNGHNVT